MILLLCLLSLQVVVEGLNLRVVAVGEVGHVLCVLLLQFRKQLDEPVCLFVGPGGPSFLLLRWVFHFLGVKK